ncbi:hypothetical protein OLZ31_20630 [Enterobacter asburiae]|nr:hypothetical protein [Enterobacter asburiae]
MNKHQDIGCINRVVKEIKVNMPDFESVSDCILENKTRMNIIQRVGMGFRHENKSVKYLSLARKLGECTQEHSCGSMACSLCQRMRRILFMNRWLSYIKEHQDEYLAVTLISYMDMLPNNKLFRWDFNAMKERYRKAISRIMFSRPVIGGFEMDYHNYIHEPELSCWMPHFHLLVPNEPEKIEQLHQYMKRDKNIHARKGRKNRPFRKDVINDPVRALSYCISGMWMEHVWFRNEKMDVKKRQKPGRIRNERVFAKSLVKLDRMSYGQLTFGVNVQAIRKKI